MSVNSVVANLSGDVAYDDDTKGTFGVSLDDAGDIVAEGESSAFADAITRIKALFSALGGSLAGSPVVSGKTAKDITVRFTVEGTTSAGKFECFAEYTVKSGTFTGNAADYATAIANFKAILQTMINTIAGVTITLT